MIKSLFEMANELADRANANGCRVTIPHTAPSPIRVMFDGDFSGAEFIPSYPSTLHIFGMYGNIAVTSIKEIIRKSENRYIVNFGDDSHEMDMLVRILE